MARIKLKHYKQGIPATIVQNWSYIITPNNDQLESPNDYKNISIDIGQMTA